MLLATILMAHLSLMNLLGSARAATITTSTPVISDACKCLDSISLPGFQTTFYYGTDGSARVPLQLSYNEGYCYGVNFHARLYNTLDTKGNTGCLAGATGGATSFQNMRAGSQNAIVPYLGTDGKGNFCNIDGTTLCSSKGPYYIELSADGCTTSGTSTKGDKRLVISPLFSCAAAPTVSKSVTLKRKLEVELGAKPNNLRCRSGYQACRTGAKRWECLQVDELDSCGGCPGTSESQDCTEVPNISSVQCVKGSCQVYKCMRGYKLVDNACVSDPSVAPRSARRKRSHGPLSRSVGI